MCFLIPACQEIKINYLPSFFFPLTAFPLGSWSVFLKIFDCKLIFKTVMSHIKMLISEVGSFKLDLMLLLSKYVIISTV